MQLVLDGMVFEVLVKLGQHRLGPGGGKLQRVTDSIHGLGSNSVEVIDAWDH